jgi:hypothetical protein
VGQSSLPKGVVVGPGPHIVNAQLGETWTSTQTVTVLSGEKKRVDLSFGAAQAPPQAAGPISPPAAEPAPAPLQLQPSAPAPGWSSQPTAPPDADSISTQKKWGHGLLWSGVVLIIAGGVSTGLAAEHGKRVSEAPKYDPEEERSLSRLWSGFMWVGYGLGAAFVATGIPLLVNAKKKEAFAGLSLAPALDGQTTGLVVSGKW